jgi:hypothetical protein
MNLLNARLQIYAVSDAPADGDVYTPVYTWVLTAWGRIEPTTPPKDVTVASGAGVHRYARILFKEATPVPNFCLVVDPSTGDQWRVEGMARRQEMGIVEYIGESAPQFTLTGQGGASA